MKSVEHVNIPGVSSADTEIKLKGENMGIVSIRSFIMKLKTKEDNPIFLSVDEGYFQKGCSLTQWELGMNFPSFLRIIVAILSTLLFRHASGSGLSS